MVALHAFVPPAWTQPSPRFVSLSPSLTELACDLGYADRLAGRSSACDYPASVAAVPVAGGFGRPNMEEIARLHPDFVAYTDLEKPALREALATLGVRALALPCETWAQLMEAARVLSRELGDEARGMAWGAAMEKRRAALAALVRDRQGPAPAPAVYVEIWGDPPTTAGAGTFLSEIVVMAGGVNLGDTLPGGYPHVSAEWVVKSDPDAILIAYMLGNPRAQAAQDLAGRLGWSSLRAVAGRRVCTGVPPELLLRAGPRCLEGAERLAAWLWGTPLPGAPER